MTIFPISLPDRLSSWWRHQMKIFFALLALCGGNSLVTGEFPRQRPVTRSFDISLICAWINGWVNNRDAGDLRRHRAHYDVTLMVMAWWFHYHKQCWLGSLAPYDSTRNRWVTLDETEQQIRILYQFTHKDLETHEHVVSTVVTDALVLKYQTIINHNADNIAIALDQFQTMALTHNVWGTN